MVCPGPLGGDRGAQWYGELKKKGVWGGSCDNMRSWNEMIRRVYKEDEWGMYHTIQKRRETGTVGVFRTETGVWLEIGSAVIGEECRDERGTYTKQRKSCKAGSRLAGALEH